MLFVLLKMDLLSWQIRSALTTLKVELNVEVELMHDSQQYGYWCWVSKIHRVKSMHWFCSIFPERYSLWYRWQDSQLRDCFCLWLWQYHHISKGMQLEGQRERWHLPCCSFLQCKQWPWLSDNEKEETVLCEHLNKQGNSSWTLIRICLAFETLSQNKF